MAPQTVDLPERLPATSEGRVWSVRIDQRRVALTNLDKPYWGPEGYTKADLLAYYWNAAPWILPYLHDRPLTLKRMPDGADGEFFYAKQAPPNTPSWMETAAVTPASGGRTVEYLLAQDAASLLWIINLGCIELHPWHARVDDIGRPDYAFFDLDPMGTGFPTVREVALLIRDALTHLGLRSYPRTSGATGMQVYIPIERVHSARTVRTFVERVCRVVHQVDPRRTTMRWSVDERPRAVYLDFGMNTEGKNIAATYSLRPERGATVATPLTWEEVTQDVEPSDFTMTSVWERLAAVGDLAAPILQGGQDLRAALEGLGVSDADEQGPRHRVQRGSGESAPPDPLPSLDRYRQRRDFSRTPEPDQSTVIGAVPPADRDEPRFVVQHHLASRLHHDLRLEHDGVAASWAVPKGLPDVTGLRHLAIHTEDHPLEYLDFSGDIPEGEYGAGQMRIWDRGTFEPLEWRADKVIVRLHGARHDGEYHLVRTDAERDDRWLVLRVGEDQPAPDPPPTLRPMLATDTGARPFDDPGWQFEVKWDGVRAIATTTRPGTGEPGRTRLTGRAGTDLSPGYPELDALWERVLARNAVLDGELVVLDQRGRSSFQRLQRRMHLRDPGRLARARETTPVSYMVFDLLAVDGEDITARALSERLALLDDVLVSGGAVRRSEGIIGHGSAMFAAATEQGIEGLVAKSLASVYRPGTRSRDWLKLKVRRSAYVLVGGWVQGRGVAASLGSILVGALEDGALRYLGRVGTGFDDAARQRLRTELDARAITDSPFSSGAPPADAHWVAPELVCRVEYAEVTDGGVLRAAAYKGVVDVAPSECRWEDLTAPDAP